MSNIISTALSKAVAETVENIHGVKITPSKDDLQLVFAVMNYEGVELETAIDEYIRIDTAQNSLMCSGFIVNDGEAYFANETDLLNYINKHSEKNYSIDDIRSESSYDCTIDFYHTDWSEVVSDTTSSDEPIYTHSIEILSCEPDTDYSFIQFVSHSAEFKGVQEVIRQLTLQALVQLLQDNTDDESHEFFWFSPPSKDDIVSLINNIKNTPFEQIRRHDFIEPSWTLKIESKSVYLCL